MAERRAALTRARGSLAKCFAETAVSSREHRFSRQKVYRMQKENLQDMVNLSKCLSSSFTRTETRWRRGGEGRRRAEKGFAIPRSLPRAAVWLYLFEVIRELPHFRKRQGNATLDHGRDPSRMGGSWAKAPTQPWRVLSHFAYPINWQTGRLFYCSRDVPQFEALVVVIMTPI